jgi:hypothetical protein
MTWALLLALRIDRIGRGRGFGAVLLRATEARRADFARSAESGTPCRSPADGECRCVRRHRKRPPAASVRAAGPAAHEGGPADAREAFGVALPRYYREPEPRILMLPSVADWTAGWFVRDALLNLLGFVPLGLFVVALLPSRRRFAVVAAVLAGGLASLGIELAQALMVERNSSLLDLLLNTAGKAGAWWLTGGRWIRLW